MIWIGVEWPIYQDCLESAVYLRSSLFWDVKWCWYVISTHVSGHPISSIFKGQDYLILLLPLLFPLALFLPPPLLLSLFFLLPLLFPLLPLCPLLPPHPLLLSLLCPLPILPLLPPPPLLLLPPFLFLLILLLLAVQPLVNLSLFQNCPPLLSVLQITSPFPHARVLLILLSWLKPPQLRFSCTSIGFCLRTLNFLQGSSSYILQRCSSHLKLPVFITFTMCGSSYTV